MIATKFEVFKSKNMEEHGFGPSVMKSIKVCKECGTVASSKNTICKKCGKFVSDVMYNADVLNCVECSPWENSPHYCLNCGIEVSLADKFCSKCGTKLLYGEVDKL